MQLRFKTLQIEILPKRRELKVDLWLRLQLLCSAWVSLGGRI